MELKQKVAILGNSWQSVEIPGIFRANPWEGKSVPNFPQSGLYTCSLKAEGDALTDYSIDGSDTADSFSYAFVCIISRGNGSNHSFYHRGEGKFGSFWSVS